MPYIFLTPNQIVEISKVDWLSTDSINYEDFNRLEIAISELAAYLISIQYNIPALTHVTNRDKTSIDFLSSINRIESNLDTIRASFVTPPGYQDKKVWAMGKGFDNNDANRLESNAQLLMDYGVLVFKSFRYAGAAICGEQGVIY